MFEFTTYQHFWEQLNTYLIIFLCLYRIFSLRLITNEYPSIRSWSIVELFGLKTVNESTFKPCENFLINNLISLKLFGLKQNECINTSIDQGRSYNDETISIMDCSFSRTLVFNGYGGVIYVSIDMKFMLVSNTMFYYCRCTGWGGAIYY